MILLCNKYLFFLPDEGEQFRETLGMIISEVIKKLDTREQMTGNNIDISSLMKTIVEKTIDGLDKGYTEEPETHIVDARNSLKEAKEHLLAYVDGVESKRDDAKKLEDFEDPIVSKESALYAVSTIDDMVLELMQD